jgi:hypothetical protein
MQRRKGARTIGGRTKRRAPVARPVPQVLVPRLPQNAQHGRGAVAGDAGEGEAAGAGRVRQRKYASERRREQAGLVDGAALLRVAR